MAAQGTVISRDSDRIVYDLPESGTVEIRFRNGTEGTAVAQCSSLNRPVQEGRN